MHRIYNLLAVDSVTSLHPIHIVLWVGCCDTFEHCRSAAEPANVVVVQVGLRFLKRSLTHRARHLITRQKLSEDADDSTPSRPNTREDSFRPYLGARRVALPADKRTTAEETRYRRTWLRDESTTGVDSPASLDQCGSESVSEGSCLWFASFSPRDAVDLLDSEMLRNSLANDRCFDQLFRRFCGSSRLRWTIHRDGEVTSHNLWPRYRRHFVGITWHNVWS